MPIPDYLLRRLVPDYSSIAAEYSTLKLPKTSFFVNTEHMHLRSVDDSFESSDMSNCVFEIDKDGNLIL